MTHEIRIFDADADYEMVSEWWGAHKREAVPLAILPKLGVIVTQDGKDVAAMWVYLDNSVGVCFLEYGVARPKIGLMRMRAAMAVGVDFLKRHVAELDYGVMLVRVVPAFARLFKGIGFSSGDSGLVCMAGLTSAKESRVKT